MFERFTDRARRVVVLAQTEAQGYPHIGTEHLLLGLLIEGEGVAALVLASLGIQPGGTRARIEQILGPPGPPVTGHLPFTPRAKKVMELSLREALQLGHNYIGTEHILLGLIHEGEGVAATIIQAAGLDLPAVRQEVFNRLNLYAAADVPEQFQIDHDQLAALYAAVLSEPIVQSLITRRVVARLRAQGGDA
jgi:ATP-dependent Clp protease ATP-binding subunit ClpC